MHDWVQQAVLILVVGAVVFVVGRLLRRGAMISEEDARRLLREGAPVVDVRTPGEFIRDPVPGAVNVPLDALRARIREVVPDSSRPVLLHCHSGGRSAVARMLLRRAGYSQAHNLGSVTRARRIVGSSSAAQG